MHRPDAGDEELRRHARWCGLAGRTRSSDVYPGGLERRLWQVELAAYATMAVSILGDYFTPWMDQMFLVGIAAMLVIGFGGILFGIVLLRNGFRPVSYTHLTLPTNREV